MERGQRVKMQCTCGKAYYTTLLSSNGEDLEHYHCPGCRTFEKGGC